MATLYISEYATSGWTTASGLPCGQEPAIAVQAVPIPGTSAAFNANTRFVRMHSDSVCSFAFAASGGTPAPTTSTARMNANQTEYFGVSANMKVGVVVNT
jgi:hypothetical protein